MNAGLLPLALLSAAAPAEPTAMARARSPIVIDGDLSDPAWSEAARIDTFYETAFGDNRAPLVATTAWLTYDDRYFYVAVKCDDPEPGKIRAPYVERDNVIGNQDNFAVFLDTRNDRRSAQEFRVNPRGIQGDAMYNDATQTEDFAPDFYYDTEARLTPEGWQAEIRIPLSSLRYPRKDPQTWGVLLWRNYPRDFRYGIYSSPFPRGSNCAICHAREINGLAGLPSSSHLVLAPYATAQDRARAPIPGEPLVREGTEFDGGLDLKWSPAAATAVDLTLNPDFSQVEADVAQIAVNERFALFFPEKRPFFLESVDLLETPIQAVYTRTITSPRWGGRTTGKAGASSYTVLLAEDEGGGSVVLPRPSASSLADQDFRSWVGVGRWRRDFGASFVGALATAREIRGGGFNRVVGPDFQWRRGGDKVTGQALFSFTETPRRPDLAPEWDGRRLDSHALQVSWERSTRTYDWFALARDLGEGFRADDGYVPQVGHREGILEAGYSFYPTGLFNRLRPYVFLDHDIDLGGRIVNERLVSAVSFMGKRNLQGFVGLRVDRVRAGGALLRRVQLPFQVQLDPSGRLPRLGLIGSVGQEVDLLGARVGTGASLRVEANARPTDHLDVQANSAVSWLDAADGSGRRGRLFSAQVQRLKATYNFSPRAFLRLIGQYVDTDYRPSAYPVPVPEREAVFSGSVLFVYRMNWQTAVFLGYGDERALDERDRLARAERQVFVKVSYSIQR